MNKLNLRGVYKNRVFKYTASDIKKKAKDMYGIDLSLDDIRLCCDIKNQTLDPVLFDDKDDAIAFMNELHIAMGLKITNNPESACRNYNDGLVEPSLQFFEKSTDGNWYIPVRLHDYQWHGEGTFAVVVTIEAYAFFNKNIYESHNGVKLKPNLS